MILADLSPVDRKRKFDSRLVVVYIWLNQKPEIMSSNKSVTNLILPAIIGAAIGALVTVVSLSSGTIRVKNPGTRMFTGVSQEEVEYNVNEYRTKDWWYTSQYIPNQSDAKINVMRDPANLDINLEDIDARYMSIDIEVLKNYIYWVEKEVSDPNLKFNAIRFFYMRYPENTPPPNVTVPTKQYEGKHSLFMIPVRFSADGETIENAYIPPVSNYDTQGLAVTIDPSIVPTSNRSGGVAQNHNQLCPPACGRNEKDKWPIEKTDNP